MDTVTHALTGTVIGYCGFRQRGGLLALWTCIAAAEFPDSDIVMAAFGGDAYLRWHRSFTHSALLWPFWAVVVAGIFWAFARKSDFKILWWAALAGLASHLALDWITTYGTLLLWPVSDTRFALGWVFILDPLVWGWLALILWAVLRRKATGAAPFGLAVFIGYVLLCGAAHALALRGQPAGTAAYPRPLNPWRWTFVRQLDDTVIWSADGVTEFFRSYHDDQLVPQAEATDTVKLFRWFAEFPVVEKTTEGGQTVLCYRDMRFRTLMPFDHGVREGRFVVAKAYFNKSGQLLGATLAGSE